MLGRTAIAAFATTALLLSGCGDDEADLDEAVEEPVEDPLEATPDEQGELDDLLDELGEHEATISVSVDPPEGWHEDEDDLLGTGSAGATVYLNEAACSEGFCDNFNVLVTPADAPAGTDFHEVTLAQLEEAPEFELLAENAVDVDGHEGYEIEYLQHDSPYGNLHFLQRYAVVGDEAGIVTFTARQDSFEDWRADAEALLATMTVTVEG